MGIKVAVNGNVATAENYTIVCGNSGYSVDFDFDEEWNQYELKTARFIWNGQYTDIVFTGNTCKIPIITDVTTLAIGAYAGDLQTTTPALVSCRKSILCSDPVHVDPTPDVYEQIISLLNEGMVVGYKGEKGDKGDKGDKGNVMYATFEVNTDTGELCMMVDEEYTGANFAINTKGELEVII